MTATLPFLKVLIPPRYHNQVALVGGTVRDMLLKQESSDIDLVAAIPDEELRALGFRFIEATSGAAIYFKHHPEYGKIEITRIDSISGLEGDLLRRDFTVNAMAMNLDGIIIDPLSGRDDLNTRILRGCSVHTFTGDPLRIFRAFRFAAAGWDMAPETESLIRTTNWSAALAGMPPERFSLEMLKALAQESPERFFQRMIEFNVGAELLPELFRMPQIPAGPLQHHPEGDLLTHSIQVLQRVTAMTDDPLARFCAFFHDLGKLATDPALYPKHHGHDHAGFTLAIDFCHRLRLSAVHRTALAWISSLHGTANLWHELRDATKLTMAERALKAGIVGILPLVATADKPGGLPLAGWDDTVRIAAMNTRELKIDGEKLEAMPAKNRSAFILQKKVEFLREGGGRNT